MSINNFLQRTATRHFIKHKMSHKEINQITQVINNSPTSMNHQQFSAIIITDDKLKDVVGTINYNQQHIKNSTIFIIFLADRTRVQKIIDNNKIKITKESQTYEIVRVITDAVIAVAYAQDALIEMGYGTTMIGTVLSCIEALQNKLNIPKTAIPILGLAVGISSKPNTVKPKMNKVFINKYNQKQALKDQQTYSKESQKYFADIDEKNFIETLTHFYQTQINANSFKTTGKMLQKALENLF